VVETTHDRQGDDGLAALGHIWLPLRYARNCLVDSLLWTGMIDVVHVLLKDALEMTVVDDEDMVYTLPTNTPQEALADGIGPRRTDRSPEDLNPARCHDASQQGTVCAVSVSDQVARPSSERRGFSQLLRNPLIGRMPRDSDMNHVAGATVDTEEGKEGPEPEIGERQGSRRPRSRAHGYGGREPRSGSVAAVVELAAYTSGPCVDSHEYPA